MTIRQTYRNALTAGAGGVRARSTVAFAAIGDHQRLPWRFFARLQATGGSLADR